MEVAEEVGYATATYPSFNSPHEGYAILKEEVDELWDHVKVKQGSRQEEQMMKEAIQVAAMAVRFVFDLEGEKAQK